MSARLAFLMVLAVLAAGGVRAAEDAAALRAAAAERRAAAEARLADARAELARARAEMNRRLQAAYAELAAADKDAAAARAERDEWRRLRENWRRERLAARAESRALLAALRALAGEKTPDALPPAAGITALGQKAAEKMESRARALVAGRRLRADDLTVAGRDGAPIKVRGLFLGGAAAYAVGESPENCGALTPLPGGGWRIGGPVFSPAALAELRRTADAVFAGGSPEGCRLPLDPTAGLAARAAAVAPDWADWLRRGGALVYPILLCGFCGLLLVGERLHYLWRTRLPAAAFAALRRGEDAGREFPETRLLRAGAAGRGLDAAGRDGLMEAALLAEEPRLNRSLPLLAALAGAAPLLGLLGTVSGMIRTFADMADAGGAGQQLLSGGIAEALITTQLGLTAALPLLLAHAWLARAVERRKERLELRAREILQAEAGDGNHA